MRKTISLRSTARNISKGCGSRHAVVGFVTIVSTAFVLDVLVELIEDRERVRALGGGGLTSSDVRGSEGGEGLRRS